MNIPFFYQYNYNFELFILFWKCRFILWICTFLVQFGSFQFSSQFFEIFDWLKKKSNKKYYCYNNVWENLNI